MSAKSQLAIENRLQASRRYYQEHKTEASEWGKLYRARNKQAILDRISRWSKKHPEQVKEIKRKSHLKNRFGLTVAEFSNMLSRQNNRCAICSVRLTQSCTVDHCHVTGRIRGLLCKPCNSRLGTFENSRWHKAAADYLRHF